MINNVKRGEDFSGYETRRCTKEGAIIDVSMSAAILRDAEQNPIGTVIILRDITDQKLMENQLLQAHKLEAIGGLAGGVGRHPTGKHPQLQYLFSGARRTTVSV